MRDSKNLCLFCKDSGYVVWTDENCATSAYCDCLAGDAAFHRDQELQADEHPDDFGEDD